MRSGSDGSALHRGGEVGGVRKLDRSDLDDGNGDSDGDDSSGAAEHCSVGGNGVDGGDGGDSGRDGNGECVIVQAVRNTLCVAETTKMNTCAV
jgi:hypothetical protein